MELLLHSKPYKVKINGGQQSFEGIIDKFSRKYITGDVTTLSERTQKSVAVLYSRVPCITHDEGKNAITVELALY
jgi:hypothetical protein